MGPYVLRRLLQMIPTLFGVLLLTFVLFHVIGGSPAAMVLGERADPALLEEFDEARGYHKPLLWGLWGPSRLVNPSRVQWRAAESPEPHNRARFPAGTHEVVLAFAPRSGVVYRATIEWRAAGPARARWEWGGAATPLVSTSAIGWRGWRVAHVVRSLALDIPADAVLRGPRLVVEQGEIEVRRVWVRRRARHAFDSQLVDFVGRMLRGDFGVSARENRRVAEMLREGIGPTLALTVPIFFGGWAVALALALVCAARPRSLGDRAVVALSIVLMSVNYLVWITVGQHVLGYRLGWFPVWGFESPWHLALPVLIGIVSGLGPDLRFYRALALQEAGRDYVRAARARGAGSVRVLFAHVLPNMMVSVVAHVASALPFLYTGSVLLESFFGIPGLGYVGVNAIHSADVDVLRAVVWVGAVLFMVANLLTDLLYAALDPRIRLD